MLSPMFNPQEFFLSEELLPLKKRGRDRSSSSTSALPQEFEIGESSRKTSLERHKEQIEEILNNLDELSLHRIEHIVEKIEGLGKGRVIIQQDFDNLEAELQEYCYLKKLYPDGIILPTYWGKKFLKKEAYKITWVEFKKLLIKKYCPRTEVQKMENEFYHLTVKGNELQGIIEKNFEIGNVIMEKKSDEKILEDIPLVKEFLEVFPEDLPGLPPVHQVEFQIDLILRNNTCSPSTL
ncbi:hypothetical protein Tco_0083685 [Tanacetum coccineum]